MKNEDYRSKLEKQYDEINNPNKTLEEIEKVSIKDYQMKEGDYKVIITVYEANELEPRPAQLLFFDLNKTAVDGFVEIQVRGETRKTAVRKQTNNPIWQESFYFQFSNLSVNDLDNSKIVINVYDKNTFIIRNSHIGRIELDWTNIYFRRFHQIYRGWLTLSDPNQDNQGSVGYILVNIAVLGPEDKVMVHDTAYIKDPLTTIEDTITNTKVRLIDYSITAEIYRAQSLIPLDLFSRNVDAYVVAKFSGNKVKTDTVTSLNPQWNKALKIGTGVPNRTKYLVLQLWNHNYFPKRHDLIGTLKIPFIDICENLYITPQWGHLYGPPMCAVDQPPNNYASKMELYGQQLGSHYRGRILFKVIGKKYVHSTNGMTEIKFKFPYKPTPVVALKTYTLSVELIEGFQLPQRKQTQVHVGMGQYMIKSQKKFNVQKRMCQFHFVMEDKKVQFPEDIRQVPDIIIYFCDGSDEKDRMCFKRIKADDVQTPTRTKISEIYDLEGDKSLGKLKPFQIGGYMNCRVNLYTNVVPASKTIESELIDKIQYDMFLYIYKGQDFPPAKIQGDCNPVLKFNCFGSTGKSSIKTSTFNPFWGESVCIEAINMQDLFATNITKGVVCQAFDSVDEGGNNDQFIGSFLIKLSTKHIVKYKPSQKDIARVPQGHPYPQSTDFIYVKPRWYYIVNPHIEIGKHIFGRVLIGVALFRKDDILQKKQKIPKYYYDFKQRERLNNQNQNKTQEQKHRKMIQLQNKKMQIYIVGLRQIKDSSKNVLTKGVAELKMSIHGIEVKFNKKKQLKRSGCDFNQLCEMEIDLPKNKLLVPFIDFKVLHNDQFYGFNSVSLYKLLPKLKEKEGMNNPQVHEDSEATILDVEALENQLMMLREKKRKEAAQYQANKLDDYQNLLDLPVPIELGNVGMNQGQDEKGNLQVEIHSLLKKAQLQIQTNSEYTYVKLLKAKAQKSAQNSSSRNINQMDKSNMENGEKKLNENEGEIVQDDQEKSRLNKSIANLSKQQSRKMDRKSGDRKSKESRGSQSLAGSKAGKFGSIKIPQTVFQNRIQLKNLAYKKTDNRKPFQVKKQPEPLPVPQPENNKPRMMQQIPQQKQQGSNNRISLHNSDSNRKLQEKKLIFGDPQGSPAQRQQYVKGVQGEEVMKRDHDQAVYKYDINANPKRQHDINFQIRTEDTFSDRAVQERAIKYEHVERVMKQEEKDQKEALERQNEYLFAQAVKLSLFGWNRKKKRKQIQTYEDYDSEIGEDLNIIPQWYKGRKILTSDFEDLNWKSSKIQTIPLFGGRLLEKTTIYQRYKQSAGHVKLICLSEATQVARQKEEEYTKLLRPKQYYCRIYVLKGKSLISHYEGKPTTFLRFTYSDEQYSYQKTRLVQNQNNPQFYLCQQIQVNLPGPSVIKIQVMQSHDILGKLITKVLGYTEIDLEQRYFTKKWHLYEKKPIELRNLYSQFGIGTQGRLETWIDLIEKKQWISTPAHKIHPPPFDKYELRVIVWSTDDCVYKNVEMQSNDVFVRGVIGTSQPQETDTHWACRSLGSFNYRFKFPVSYPPKPEDMYSDVFMMQIWDKDLIGFNNLIGETRVNMNKIHKIIQKAVKRRKAVKACMKVKEKNFAITERFWFDVYNHKQKDEFGIPQPQGRAQLSFELVPIEMAEDSLKNGFGRSEPNVYPTLPQPTGRLQFDFLSPLAFIKQILGPNLYRKWCCKLICCLIIVIIAFFGYVFFPDFIAVKVASA